MSPDWVNCHHINVSCPIDKETNMTLLERESQTQTADLTTLGAAELATLIAHGEISSSEAVEAHIERIERVNPALNAVVVKRYDAARAEAREADKRQARGEALG